MDTYWKKRLNEDFVRSRIEGSFDRANKEALQNRHAIESRRLEPAEKLSKVMKADIAKKQQDQDIAQIQDYLYDFYGYDGFRNDGIMEEIKKFGKKSRKHRQASNVLESALGLNQFRSETKLGGALTSAMGGGVDLVYTVQMNHNVNEESLKLAREFLGLKRELIEKSEPKSGDEAFNFEERWSDASSQNSSCNAPALDRGSKHDIEKNLPSSDELAVMNPFNLKSPDLRQQAQLLELNPVRARTLIRAAGRDPKIFGI